MEDARAALHRAWRERETAPERAGALARAATADDPETAAARDTVLGYLAFRDARQAEAIAAAAAAMAVLPESSVWRSRALNVRSCALSEIGEYEQGTLSLQEQLRVSRRNGDAESEAAALHDLGVLYGRGDIARAGQHLRDARAIFERLHDGVGQAFCAFSLGEVLAARGDDPDENGADELFARAADLGRASGHTPIRVYALARRGELALARGDARAAEGFFREAHALEGDAPARPLWVAVPNLARLLVLQRRLTEARDLLLEQLHRAERAEMHAVRVAVHELLAEVHEALAEPWEALRHTREYLRLFKQENADRQGRRVRALEVLHRTELAEQEARREREENAELRRALAELAELHRQVERASVTDALTGVFNRRHLMSDGAARLRALPGASSVAILDIDFFKRVNDDFGHEVGDGVLRTFARFLGERLPPGREVSRYGGEEFVVVFPHTPPSAAAAELDAVRAALAHAAVPGLPADHPLSFTAGVAACREGALEDALRRADALLLRGKRAGRARVEHEAEPVLDAEP